MRHTMPAPRAALVVIPALLVAGRGLPSPASAASLCVYKSGARVVRQRPSCKPNEIAIDPGALASPSRSLLTFGSETQIGPGPATLFVSIDGRLSTDESKLRTPLAAGTADSLRCFVSAASGGGGFTVTLGHGPCAGPLSYGGPLVASFLGSDAQVATSASGSVPVAAGECVALRIDRPTTTSSFFLNCSVGWLAAP